MQLSSLQAGLETLKVEQLENEEENEVNCQLLLEDPDLAKQVKETKHSLARSQRDQILDFKALCFFPNAQLPEKIKMPPMEKFIGTGNPLSYVRHIINTLKPMGLNNELIAQLF